MMHNGPENLSSMAPRSNVRAPLDPMVRLRLHGKVLPMDEPSVLERMLRRFLRPS